MHVRIDHRERQEGILWKTTFHVVEVEVQFSEEEKAIIADGKLQETPLVLLAGEPFITVKDILRGKVKRDTETSADAKAIDELLVENLKAFKGILDDYDPSKKSRSFEV